MATRRFSSTVSPGSRRLPSGTIATPAPRTCSGRRRVRSASPSSTRPLLERSTPPTASTSDDLPAPFGPSSVVISPGGIASETSCSTRRPPRATQRSSNRSSGRWRLRRARRRALARLDVLGAQVGAHDVLVAQHVGGRPRGDQPAEVEHRGRRAARLDEAHVVVDEDHERAELARGCSGSRRPGARSPRRGGLRPARRAARLGRADDGAGDLDQAPVARAEPADLHVRRHLEADVLDRAQDVGPPRRAAAPECSWIIAMLSNTDSCSIAISVWNVRRSPQRARR